MIQVKCRTKRDATEGVEALRSLIGVSVIEDNVKGCIFISIADYFSTLARAYAKKVVNKQHIEMFDLIDCREFLKRLDLTKNKLPTAWNQPLCLKD